MATALAQQIITLKCQYGVVGSIDQRSIDGILEALIPELDRALGLEQTECRLEVVRALQNAERMAREVLSRDPWFYADSD
jgi:hypothetical protein